MNLIILPFVYGVLAAASLWASDSTRIIPRPLPSHPGNIFLEGEKISIPAPTGSGDIWQLKDYEGRLVTEGKITVGRAEVGRLRVGYYELACTQATNPVSLGVLPRLRSPTPAASPIAIDVAMAWFYPKEKMASVANLCALAGVNWVRDRLNWMEMEPKKGQFAPETRYDSSAAAQSGAGLRVLQVSHRSADWANPDSKRFPLDLRDTYSFHRAMAERWRGQVAAFEPWNEADITMFGGHTGSEMAALQKAAYLGLKAGNPNVVACMNVFALHRAATLQDLQDNEAWPYFDTFNLHHYEPFAAYPKLYADFRAVSAGKPLWVTECSVPVKWSGASQLKEPTPQDLRVQSERIAVTYAQALHEGAREVFYFMLPHYVEGQTQFGIIRPDLTPRPAFLALAAAGRLLADAHPLGRLQAQEDQVRGFLFEAKPDGKAAQVLVIWSERPELNFELPKRPRALFDHLGRPQGAREKTIRLSTAPLYLLLAPDTRLALVPPPARPAVLPGHPSQVVLQALLPESSLDLEKSAYKIPAGQESTIRVFAYNFGRETARGRLSLSSPEPWKVESPAEVELAPGERKELSLRLNAPASNGAVSRVRVLGDFGPAGQAVLSVRFVAPPGGSERTPLP